MLICELNDRIFRNSSGDLIGTVVVDEVFIVRGQVDFTMFCSK